MELSWEVVVFKPLRRGVVPGFHELVNGQRRGGVFVNRRSTQGSQCDFVAAKSVVGQCRCSPGNIQGTAAPGGVSFERAVGAINVNPRRDSCRQFWFGRSGTPLNHSVGAINVDSNQINVDSNQINVKGTSKNSKFF